MRSLLAPVAIFGAVFAAASPDPNRISDYILAAKDTVAKSSTTTTQTEPCAEINSILAANQKAFLDPQLALQCLQSVPVDKAGDASQLVGMQTYINFQSTLTYLKTPPPGYLYPAVDVLGGLDKISTNLQNDQYASEYDFQLAVSNLISSAHDGHFNYFPDIVTIFFFEREFGLFSLSNNGTSIPEVYVELDVPRLAGVAGAGQYTPSPVIEINGQDVETFLTTLATSMGSNQDPDANYNSNFAIQPLVANQQSTDPFFEEFVGSNPGTDTIVKFKNGTSLSIKTFATTANDFTGVTDGASFFKIFCQGNAPVASAAPSASASASASASTLASFSKVSATSASAQPSSSSAAARRGRRQNNISSAPASSQASSPASSSQVQLTQVPYTAVPSQSAVPDIPYYPRPYLISSDMSIACYFPMAEPDLMVFAIPTFTPANNVEFQDYTRLCLATANKLGKKRLIIDLRGNGGGTVLLAYDMFKQLFPSMQPWGTSNFRAWELFDQIGQITTTHWEGNTTAELGLKAWGTNYGSIFNVQEDLTAADGDFKSWEDFYGPVHYHGDTFTNLVRYNLSSKLDTLSHGISGYGNLSNIDPKQTFQAGNIVLLQDGQCASTCAVFAEFMKSQAKIGSVVFGGRPQSGPMQGVGGVKGANVYSAAYLLQLAEQAFKEAPASQQKSLTQQWETKFKGIEQALLRAPGADSARVNIRNNIREGDSSRTPLQFVYEAADCRLFYTAEQILEQDLVWKAAYNSYWNGAACVAGSTNQASSKPGTGYILSAASNTTSSDGSKPSKGAAAHINAGGLTAAMGFVAAGALFL